MKAIFLLSNNVKKINGKSAIMSLDNSQRFIDRLRKECPKIKKLVMIASNPDINNPKTEVNSNILKESLNLDGFNIQKMVIVNDGYFGNLQEELENADVVYLMGGHVPTQNEFINKINLKKCLKKFKGVLIGQSAGAMNITKNVYVQPYNEQEFNDSNFKKIISGLGFVDIQIYPHMNRAKIDELCGETTYSMCLKDSYKIPHYGITDGGYILVKDGKTEAFGETVYFKDGKEIKLCEDGESFVIYEKGKENEKNN